jgi:hypothetical protein
MLKNFKLKLRSASFVVCLLLTLLYCFGYNLFRNWHGSKTPFIQDVDQYYSFLPALFVHGDLSFKFEHQYWLIEAENGARVPKVSMGMAFIYLPGFLIGHCVAWFSGAEMNGYSQPYAWAVYFCSMLYALIGIWLLRKLLLRYFSEFSTSLSIVAVVLATNFVAYTISWAEMTHNYLFVLYVIMLHLMARYHDTGALRPMLWMALVSGLVIIIRPVELLFLVIPLLYGVYNKESLLRKVHVLLSHRWKWLLVFAVFMLPILPQLIYWNYMTGHFLYFSYGSNERFFFNNPQLLNFLISFKKGWLFYSPVMLFSLIGLIYLRKYTKEMQWALPVFLVIIIYFLSSWWSWWYGGSFGNRSMVQYYAFLSLPLAAFIDHFKAWKLFRLGFPVLLAFLVWLNLYQLQLYRKSHLHWDSMARESYIYLMKHSLKGDMDFDYYFSLLKAPDYEAAQKGEYDHKWYE